MTRVESNLTLLSIVSSSVTTESHFATGVVVINFQMA